MALTKSVHCRLVAANGVGLYAVLTFYILQPNKSPFDLLKLKLNSFAGIYSSERTGANSDILLMTYSSASTMERILKTSHQHLHKRPTEIQKR